MSQSTGVVTAARVAALVGAFPRSPAYAGLAEALTLVIGDGRLALGARLPSERDLTGALKVSRTTVTRAYAVLRESGYAEARPGAGTFTRVPAGHSRVHDHALVPRPNDAGTVDLGCAAGAAPPGLAAAFTAALGELPAYLGGHGYFPAGLPRLQEAVAASYAARGLPTDPEQVLVVPGALSAAAIVAQAYLSPGDRALVESPVYPNATAAIRHSGARLLVSPVDPGGWDLDAVGALLRRARPSVAYLIPDFQNPTGLLMADAERAAYADHLRRAGTLAVVDEAHQALDLDGGSAPRPFAAHHADTITLGSASKAFWGGLRLGWIRAPHAELDRITRARVRLDLGAPVLEQLVLARLLADGPVLAGHLDRLGTQRSALLAALAHRLPDWSCRRPRGGLAAWCRLPDAAPATATATALAAEADRRGVVVTPGPAFAVEGGMDRFVRVPWTRPAAELELAVARLAEAWDAVLASPGSTSLGRRRPRVLVA